MSGVIATLPKFQFSNALGLPMSGGTLTSYLAGTTTPVTTYQDEALTSANTNPITLDSRGECTIWLDSTKDYKFVLKNALGVTQWTVDDITGAGAFADRLRTDLAASSGASLVGYMPTGTGAVATTLQGKARESVTAKDFGAVGDGVANDTDEFNAALTYCKANNIELEITSGTYLLTAGSVNFAGQGLSIVGKGKPTLQFTGSGRAFVLDTLLSDGDVFGGMTVENLLIIGGPSVTDGFYSRGIARSVFRNIEVRECNNNAFTILHGVSNQYDSLKFSTNEVAQTTTPTNGLVLNANGAGYYTADCTFINTIMEGFPGKGCYILSGSGNVFVGGTFEAAAIGLDIAANNYRNHFINVWFEANTVGDAEIYGGTTTFDSCYFGSNAPSGNNVEIATGEGTVFNGGFIRKVNMQATSKDSRFLNVGLSDNVSLGFAGTGTYTRIGCTKIDTNGAISGNFEDSIGPVQEIAFPATNVPSSNVNVLDDYQEGTFTPVLTPAGGTITPNASFTGGRYTKIGNLVTVNGTVYVTSVSSPTGDLKITGLPFVSKTGTTEYRTGSVYGSDLQATATQPIMLNMNPGESQLYITKLVSGVASNMAPEVKAASAFHFSITYQVNEI